MNKIYGIIIGLLIGIIISAAIVYLDSIINVDCESIWKCSSSAIFKFGPVNIMIILSLIGAVVGLVVGIFLDRK